ncbi:MAG TPA: pyridoxal 5'-phosphate synthase glutaminase subunit PdxT [Bacillales bacterium]|nr:pyridoxal 5'-phosphate synthase glutaminase subunit PdxT [Bacillales bacterium]
MVKIGVLALQGAVAEHVKALEASGAETTIVKRIEQLDEIDGLVMPGGESTTMRRLIDKYHFFEPLKAFAEAGKPVFGTCAGLILLASRIEGQDTSHLGLMDMTVRRNAFGRQRESFEAELMINGVDGDFIGVFIRAPYIIEVGPEVEILSKHDEKIVAARQGHLLTCAFHPELADDPRFHGLFVRMVEQAKNGLHKIGK